MILPLGNLFPRNHLKSERDQNREAVLREKWWRFKRTNEALRAALAPLDYCFAVSRVSKWAIFLQSPSQYLPADSTTVVASDDFYVLGIITSDTHRQWVKAQCSTLEDRTRYTNTTCFETFPFPQAPTANLVKQIRSTMQELHQYRSQVMERMQWGITKLYNSYFNEPASQLYKLHAKLDQLVMQAYGFKADDDILTKLLGLNTALAEKEKRGEHVIGPYAPTSLP